MRKQRPQLRLEIADLGTIDPLLIDREESSLEEIQDSTLYALVGASGGYEVALLAAAGLGLASAGIAVATRRLGG